MFPQFLRLLNWLFGWPLIPRKSPCYVIVYDEVDPYGVEDTEYYYGYFSSPEEARALWDDFGHNLEPGAFVNVKLCMVVENW